MIENANESKNPSTGEFIDIKKYVGVASMNIVSINPNNAKLRALGWDIPEGADEPEYVYNKERDGKIQQSARVRFMVQIQDLEEKPVIPLDFWIGPEVMMSADKKKGKIIDVYGRTAWGTQEEVKLHKVPQYASGTANISSDYKLCHRGQEELIAFLMKYLNISPFRIFDKKSNEFIPNKNPGKLTIDDWQRLCDGDVSELVKYVSLQPQNRVKVILGVRTNDENRSYQTFLQTRFMGNGLSPDRNTGEYPSAQTAIDKWFEEQQKTAERNPSFIMPNVTYSAAPVKEWKVNATEVSDASESQAPMEDDDDLPFA